MAKWPHSAAAKPPAELLEVNFDPKDWPLGPPGTTPRQRWRAAQFEWLEQHPDLTIDGLDAIDLIFATDPTDLEVLNRLLPRQQV